MSDLTFEQTMSQLQGWLHEQVAVSVHPSQRGAPVQVAMLMGKLVNTQEPPGHIQAQLPASAPVADSFFFFVAADEAGQDRSHFVLTESAFTGATMEGSNLGKAMLTIWLNGIHLRVILQPNT